MKGQFFDRDLLRTVLFSLAVVLMIIGIYQTVLLNNLPENYPYFALAISFWFGSKLVGRLGPEANTSEPTKSAPAAKPNPKQAKPNGGKRPRR